MSLCLIRSGINIPGRMAIKKGPHKSKLIEPGQVALTNILKQHRFFGAPKPLLPADRKKAIKGKQGIISFMHISDYVTSDGVNGGHIDLARWDPTTIFGYELWADISCAGRCHWNSAEVLFWPLK